MAGKIQKVVREVNGITIEQRSADGFINATAMCVAHSRDIDRWLVTNATFELFCALASDLDITFKPADLRDSDVSTLSASQQEPLAYRFGGDERNASAARIPPVYNLTNAVLSSGRVDDVTSKYLFLWRVLVFNILS